MREKEYNEDERSGKHSVRQGTRNTAKKTSLNDMIDIEATPIKTKWRRNQNDIIWAALQLKMEGKEHELDKMRGYLMRSNILPPEVLKEWYKG